MILLNDVAPDGQCMRYVRGSHCRYYDHTRFFSNTRFEQDLVRTPPADDDVLVVSGPAGTAAVFDTNGLHSGTRDMPASRDTLIFYYNDLPQRAPSGIPA